MRIFLILAVVLACVAAAEKGDKRCAKREAKFNQCLTDGYVRRKCGDKKAIDELTPEMKKCARKEKILTKNCGMKCPKPDPKPDQSCWDKLQKDYRGKVNVTTSGYPCMNWKQQSPHKHSRTEANYPSSGLGDHNYCRNPDNEPEGAWCYTTNPNQRWDYCGIPKCATGEASCWDGLQKDYRGPLQVTESGEKCQKWTAQSPQGHSRTEANYPGSGLGDHNYCRNPDNEEGGAWCYTTNPYQRWDYCGAPRCLDEEKYCWDGLQKSYRGPKQTTRKGKQCQKWTVQSPHKHSRTEANYPDEGLGDHNYCRNPDNEPGGAWCYTTDPKERWDYCQVKTCEKDADIENAGKTEPQTCWEGLQKDYRGDVAKTMSGYDCMNWKQQSPHSHSRTEANYPDTGLGDHNYCRNPDNEPEGAWCYTTNPDQRWDYCGVPKCTEKLCWKGLQKNYRGPLQTTASGRKCQKWTVQAPQKHSRTEANYPNSGLGDHNYCRNPDNEPEGAWCYTTDSGKRWEYCGVPKCDTE